MPWWYWCILYFPVPFFARWYYAFLRERSGNRPMHPLTCKHHGDWDLNKCCFAKKENWQQWPDWSAAATAILVAVSFWPLIGLIFFVMDKPKKTSREIELAELERERRIAELEADNERLKADAEIGTAVSEHRKGAGREMAEIERPVRIWHDWEFFEDGRTILPISVGMYREIDGAELYAVFSNVDPFMLQQNSWLYANVWPTLNRTGDGPINWTEDFVKSKPQIRRDITQFIGASSVYGEVQLWGDFCAYDHVALAQLWGPMIALPGIIPMHTNDLRTEIARRGLTDAQLPPEPSTRHNALADAKHEALVMRFLGLYDRMASGPDREGLISAAVEGRWPKE